MHCSVGCLSDLEANLKKRSFKRFLNNQKNPAFDFHKNCIPLNALLKNLPSNLQTGLAIFTQI